MRTYMFSIFAGCILLSGCTSTPDLAGWADSSAALTASIAAGNRSTLAQIDTVGEQIKQGQQEGWVQFSYDTDQEAADFLARWEQRRRLYFQSTVAINSTMGAMVEYAQAVAELAAAGQSGREASADLLTSTQLILSTANRTYPKDSSVGAAVDSALAEAIDLVTRVQAQDELAQTMALLTPAVESLVNKVNAYIKAQRRVISHVARLREDAVRGAYGDKRIAWSLRNNSYQKIESLFETSNNPERSLATLQLLERELEHVRAFNTELSAARFWRNSSAQRLNEIASAVNTWANTHQQAVHLLKKCGGMRSLRSKCGAYTAANLKLAKARIDNVITEYKATLEKTESEP